MSKIVYVEKRFSAGSLSIIEHANTIIEEYQQQGFDLTLRQLYYQFVSRDLISNKQSEYKRLGSIINDARLAGRIDWSAIEDRTRNIQELTHWESPARIIAACVTQYRIDVWKNQEYRPYVWIEKDALLGVIAGVCNQLRVPYFSCRGFVSQSEMWANAMRMKGELREQQPVIIHLGDHDPSGIDMTRDIADRIRSVFRVGILVRRIALNLDQVHQYSPPPNPAKTTDSRYASYVNEYGDESWELDALEPSVLSNLIQDTIEGFLDEEKWQESMEREDEERGFLQEVADLWEERGRE